MSIMSHAEEDFQSEIVAKMQGMIDTTEKQLSNMTEKYRKSSKSLMEMINEKERFSDDFTQV